MLLYYCEVEQGKKKTARVEILRRHDPSIDIDIMTHVDNSIVAIFIPY